MQYDPSKKKAKPEEKLKPVISSGAKLKKRSAAEKTAGAFFQEDIKTAGKSMLNTVLIPAAKNMFYSAVMNTLGVSLWGQNGAPRVGNGGWTGGGVNAGRINYSGISNGTVNNQNRLVAGSVAGFDYDKIEFTTAGDAQLVLDAMQDNLERGFIVTVASMYDLAGVSNNNFMADKYGWDSLVGAKIMPMLNGSFCIRMPRPKPVE